MSSSRPLHTRPEWRRRAIVAAIVLVVGGLFVQREFLAGSDDPGGPGVIDRGQRPVVGEPAPDFALERVDTGELVRLSDYRGKTVLLNFWATWCAPCRFEMPEFQEVYEERLPDDDFVVLAVDVQEPDRPVQAFLDDLGLTFPVAMDRTGSVMQHYAVPGLPATFFIDPDGILRARTLGPVFGDLLADGIAAADRAGEPPEQ
jgi:peroxiredoxin